MYANPKVEQLYQLLNELFPGQVGGQDAGDHEAEMIELKVSLRNNASSPDVEHKEILWLHPFSKTMTMFPYYEKEDENFILFSFEKNNY